MGKWGVAVLAVSFLGGCSSGENVAAAENEVAAFHARLDRGQFKLIYDSSGADVKGITPEAEMVKLFEVIHTKLGRFEGGKTVGWNDNVNTSGHFVSLNYEATYQKGRAQENFVYRLGGGRPSLAGYHITSNTLITG